MGSRASASALRRMPIQARSRDKVDRILAAAEALVKEIGYDGCVSSPVTLIERSGVNSGSFYTYFTSVQAVLEELTFRYMDRAYALIDAVRARGFASWEEANDAVVDAFEQFHRDPVVRELWNRTHMSEQVLKAQSQLQDYLTAVSQELLVASSHGRLQAPDVAYAVTTMVGNFLVQAALGPGPDRPDVLAQAKVVMRAYLATFEQEEGPRPG
ncbi:TetR/AcrR family transcriptional regulator [Nonomuraea zeae]|uniref:TetR/AcrR family transcriptional regulator n=1 Tax=Nonomuraea zeae TaxID=1642303 RepID=A0A5S4GD43_9ACTN|nr:TetR/AcrR family transcriptional regulator [Nonomuraea zeae]TMR30923.1 TetR/AcrR family transcriptional regulator [Nonomuraea zeae]